MDLQSFLQSFRSSNLGLAPDSLNRRHPQPIGNPQTSVWGRQEKEKEKKKKKKNKNKKKKKKKKNPSTQGTSEGHQGPLDGDSSYRHVRLSNMPRKRAPPTGPGATQDEPTELGLGFFNGFP